MRPAWRWRCGRPARSASSSATRADVPPADLSWEQDQDLGVWARHLMKGSKPPLDPPPAGSVGVWPLLRPTERRFDHEVSILHDLTPLLLPGTHKPGTRSHFQGLCARAIASSDVAVAVSHSTRADAEWLTTIDPARIVVAHSGPSLCVTKHAAPQTTQRQAHVGLVVSTLEPRKNPEFFCDWFHTSTALPPDAELWWVGSIGWITSRRDLKAFEQRPGSRRRIRFLGVVSDAQLCKLYQTAAYSAYPSLYEGFGFPRAGLPPPPHPRPRRHEQLRPRVHLPRRLLLRPRRKSHPRRSLHPLPTPRRRPADPATTARPCLLMAQRRRDSAGGLRCQGNQSRGIERRSLTNKVASAAIPARPTIAHDSLVVPSRCRRL